MDGTGRSHAAVLIVEDLFILFASNAYISPELWIVSCPLPPIDFLGKIIPICSNIGAQIYLSILW
jgi:hypothetical protein